MCVNRLEINIRNNDFLFIFNLRLYTSLVKRKKNTNTRNEECELMKIERGIKTMKSCWYLWFYSICATEMSFLWKYLNLPSIKLIIFYFQKQNQSSQLFISILIPNNLIILMMFSIEQWTTCIILKITKWRRSENMQLRWTSLLKWALSEISLTITLSYFQMVKKLKKK